ncbi:Uncharacterized protein OS=Knoellia aerolata DSM 18566 GN=N801_17695 PE=4 SV=1 [Gemmata massiliana]|uniref:Prokaryotic YEATS domain-containing protein n=1 Tax=Gemmata massiliana TaxID=1210884 RepID=A0A6P2D1R3_9BACT|nr:pYEATS domain-containing protein [Gemmata massiliana]VTR94325.1 Uncharacterized protein OS=Knoellia aerolata DSM 18566 GN=N801_17695 PE=4 SV=1 [Gemmata massiliana]
MALFAEAEANIWTALPSILWVGFAAVALFALRKPLGELLSHLLTRVRAGAPMKFGAFEFGAIRAEQHSVPTPISYSSAIPEGGLEAAEPHEGQPTQEEMELSMARDQHKEATKHLMLVHRLFLSAKQGQIYDALIYVVPTRSGSLAGVTRVDYFFGRYWGNKIFTSADRSRGFPILTSAYGAFLCCARVWMNDGTSALLVRHIDFEMGAYAPVLAAETEPKKP